MQDHGIVYTTPDAPYPLPREDLRKCPIRVEPADGEFSKRESRVNYGKCYVVEHNVKICDIGLVVEV
jgi:hypothetical protein